mgnify:CR=1 FL=1
MQWHCFFLNFFFNSMQLNVRIGAYAIVPMDCVRVSVVLAVVMEMEGIPKLEQEVIVDMCCLCLYHPHSNVK